MKKGITGLSLIFIFICLSFAVFKNDAFASLSNPIEITGKHIVSNNETLISGRFVFVLTSVNNSPMPEGSKSGVKKVTINSNESFGFGKISYDAPGEYRYTVSRELSESKYIKQDDSVYECTAQVTNDGLAVVVFKKIGTDGKPNSIIYTDRYIKPGSRGDGAETGDRNDFLTVSVAVLSILFILVLMSADRLKIRGIRHDNK